MSEHRRARQDEKGVYILYHGRKYRPQRYKHGVTKHDYIAIQAKGDGQLTVSTMFFGTIEDVQHWREEPK